MPTKPVEKVSNVKHPRFEIFRARGKQPYRWRLIAANGEPLFPEGFVSKPNARRGAKALVKAVATMLASGKPIDDFIVDLTTPARKAKKPAAKRKGK